MKKIGCGIAGILFFFAIVSSTFALSFRKPCKKTVQTYALSPPLAFSIMKAESGFKKNALSGAGAMGLMQLMPSTAKFVCERNEIPFAVERLYEGDYNAMIGCLYLNYLSTRFFDAETMLAAYNAGEGIVASWLKNTNYSDDGVRLKYVPYVETRRYVKKVLKYQKIYAIFD